MAMNTHLSEQEIIRREKRRELEKLGIDPYPAPEFPITHSSVQIKAERNRIFRMCPSPGGS